MPGDDPAGTPGVPIAGQRAYLWAHVRNTGSTDIANATVRFYWANPGAGVDRTTATLVGTSFVTLAAGGASDVLCLAPWIPSFVNGGHECILGEAFDPVVDPIPLVSPSFEVPTDRHVAQRNIAVLAATPQFQLVFEVHNASRLPRTFAIEVEQVPLRELGRVALHRTLGDAASRLPPDGKVRELALVDAARADATHACSPRAHCTLAGRGRAGLTVAGELASGAALLRITQTVDGKLVGGTSAVIVGRGAKS